MDMLSARAADAAVSDGQLLARIARGDKDAVTALYRRLERPLFAFLVKTLRDREAAAATWIYSIAHHKAVSWLRKRREVELDEEAVAAIPDDTPGADKVIATR